MQATLNDVFAIFREEAKLTATKYGYRNPEVTFRDKSKHFWDGTKHSYVHLRRCTVAFGSYHRIYAYGKDDETALNALLKKIALRQLRRTLAEHEATLYSEIMKAESGA